MKVSVEQRLGYRDVKLFEYECTDAVPMVGDIYASIHFEDGYQRTIKERQLIPGAPDSIIVMVDYSFQILVPAKQELTETEAAHIVQCTEGALS